jgi:hypothetical protein
MNIVDSAAAHTAQMVVTRDIGIETGLGAREFQLSNDSGPRQQFQIAVNGTQTDFGDPPPDNFVKRNSRRVRLELLEFFQDDLPLSGTALKWFGSHRRSYCYQ